MSQRNWMLGGCFAVLLGLLALGCAGKAGNAAPFEEAKGKHPENWLQVHWAEYVKDPNQCRTCHGSTTERALAGGISKVSCFSCHEDGVNHPTSWANPSLHGAMGAKLAPSADPKVMAGFAHCTKCHGSDYTNGMAVSCRSCHTSAPHPARPWTGTTATGTNHVYTDQGNIPECFRCHEAGANSTLKPVTPAPAGTAPGCFNNTMCHDKF